VAAAGRSVECQLQTSGDLYSFLFRISSVVSPQHFELMNFVDAAVLSIPARIVLLGSSQTIREREL
jgi:hypothetical protein